MKKIILICVYLLCIGSLPEINAQSNPEKQESKEEIFFNLLSDMSTLNFHDKTYENRLEEKIQHFMKENMDLIDVNYTQEGQGFLHLLSHFDRKSKLAAQILHELYERKVNINAKDLNGDSPLHRVVYLRRIPLVEYLVAKGALLDQQNNEGKTPLNMIPYYPNAYLDLLLLENGADPNIADKDGNLPIHTFIQQLKFLSMEKAIEVGSSLTKENLRGESPLDLLPDVRNHLHKGQVHIVHQYIDLIQFLRKKAISYPYERDKNGDLKLYNLSRIDLARLFTKHKYALDLKKLIKEDHKGKLTFIAHTLDTRFTNLFNGKLFRGNIFKPLRVMSGRR